MRRFFLTGCLILCGFMAACGNGATVTVVQSPTTPPAMPTATPDPTLIAACFGNAVKPTQVIVAGDMYLLEADFNGLSYPAVMLPDGTTITKPYKLTDPGGGSDFPTSPATNPLISDEHNGSLVVKVCNTSQTQTHTVQSVWLKVASITPYTGSLSEWLFCNGVMDSHHTLTGGGCGGAKAFCECFHVTLTDALTVGASYGAKQTGNDLNAPGDGLGVLPLSLAPGKVASFDVGIDKPALAAQYQFQLGVKVDAGVVAYGPPSTHILFAPVAHEWGALHCQAPAMLAQITPTSPESYYICP